MKLGIFFYNVKNNPAWSTNEPEEALAWLKEQGIEGLQFSINEIKQLDQDQFLKAMGQYGIQTACVHTTYRITSADDEIFNTAVRQTIEELPLIHKFGAKKLMVVPFNTADIEEPEDKPRALTRMAEAIELIAPVAKLYGIELFIENISKYLLPYATVEDIQNLTSQAPSVKYNFDTGNWAFLRQNVPEAYRILKNHIAMIHVKDYVHVTKDTPGAKQTYDGSYVKGAPFGQGEGGLSEIMPDAIQAFPDMWFIIENDAGTATSNLAEAITFTKSFL